MYYNTLDSRLIRDRIDLIQTYQEWMRMSDLARTELAGTMGYEERSGRPYLYRRSTKNGLRSTKSLGPKSPKRIRSSPISNARRPRPKRASPP